MRTWMTAAVILSVVVPSLAMAQTKTTTPRQPKTIIVFGGDLIDASIDRPDGTYFDAPAHARFPSLIKLRANFDDKIKSSVHELR